ncbi:MAG: hypothetical protein M3540_07305 [Actinomycetota bacterium]|nr:hypothetical protein [Actinomycetota bacterium]
MPPYSSSPSLTVAANLKQPIRISRDLASLATKRFIADKVFTRGTPDQVAGGSMVYEKSESIYLDRDVEEIAERGSWPRTGWSEALYTELVHQYGLEVPISNLAIRRNQRDQFVRGQLKLANMLVKFVDTKAMSLLTTVVGGVQTLSASAVWTTVGTKIASDIAAAQEMIDILDEGLVADTLILNPRRRDDLINNDQLAARLPREAGATAITTGEQAPFMGLRQILYTNQIAQTTAVLMASNLAGTIADERPDPEEGFQAYQPAGGDFAPIWVKVYDDHSPKDKIVAAGRWPAMALVEPRAVVVITGVS